MSGIKILLVILGLALLVVAGLVVSHDTKQNDGVVNESRDSILTITNDTINDFCELGDTSTKLIEVKEFGWESRSVQPKCDIFQPYEFHYCRIDAEDLTDIYFSKYIRFSACTFPAVFEGASFLSPVEFIYNSYNATIFLTSIFMLV